MIPEDVNMYEEQYFELIDMENTRHMKQKSEIFKEMQAEYCRHQQNLQAIWASFGGQRPCTTSRPKQLSRKMKRKIKAKVKRWSQTDPASGCFSSNRR